MTRHLAALFLTLAPTAALAHPGDHGHMAAIAVVRHLLTEPDHQATLGAGVPGLLVAAWVARTRAPR